jgi:hypothetical protein
VTSIPGRRRCYCLRLLALVPPSKASEVASSA